MIEQPEPNYLNEKEHDSERETPQICSDLIPIDRTFKLGDYVLACKFSDADPRDRWRVDFINEITLTNPRNFIRFKNTGAITFYYAKRITMAQGTAIIEKYTNLFP